MEILLADLLISLLEVDEEEKTEMETERKLEAIAMLESYDGRDVSWRQSEPAGNISWTDSAGSPESVKGK